MSLVFNKSPLIPEGGNFIKGAGCFFLVGTITFSGSYATGGDTFASGKSPEDIGKQIGAGRVIAFLTDLRGNNPEWDATAKKLKLFSTANTEVTAAAYNAALTASPVPVVVMLR